MRPESRLVRRVRRWWQEGSYLEDVAWAFTVITVVNSGMMLVGWDTPKNGAFAYTHLLGRLAIVAAVVALFHFDGLRRHVEQWRSPDGRGRVPTTHHGRLAHAVELVVRAIPEAPLSRAAAVFTVVTGALCLVTITFSWWLEPRGGAALYRALLVLAATSAVLVGGGTWWYRSRPAPPRPGE